MVDVGQSERRLTVARVRVQADHAEVMFYETARIYRMPGSNPCFADALRDLRAAMAAGTPVRVRFVEPNGEVIESVGIDS